MFSASCATAATPGVHDRPYIVWRNPFLYAGGDRDGRGRRAVRRSAKLYEVSEKRRTGSWWVIAVLAVIDGGRKAA